MYLSLEQDAKPLPDTELFKDHLLSDCAKCASATKDAVSQNLGISIYVDQPSPGSCSFDRFFELKHSCFIENSIDVRKNVPRIWISILASENPMVTLRGLPDPGRMLHVLRRHWMLLLGL